MICISACYFNTAWAGPADYVYTPLVEQGEKEIDFKFGTAKGQDDTRKTVYSLGLGYGVSEYWFTEVYLKREREGSEGLTIGEWENKFQLTETGKYAVDVGLITEIEAPLSNSKEPWEFKVGPLFQTEFGKLQLNGNVLFERTFGGDNVEHITEMGYQWQAKYRWIQEFEFGLQGMGEMGEWDHWEDSDDQNHRIGPAVFGKLNVGQKQAIKYNAALLFGASDAAPDHTFRLQVEYEF
ncbi:MAG TPA: hypothetical protein DCG63_06480 [Methylophilaceae bacterium]|nr:hypothetical protein [Methylophilaceae bacterium]